MARDVAGCEAMLAALVPGFEPRALESLEDGARRRRLARRVPTRSSRPRRGGGRALPHARRSSCPFPDGVDAFIHEVADVHRELFAEQEELYGEDVRDEDRALPRRDARRAAAADRERERYRERVDAICAEVDLLLAPTLPFVAPPRRRRRARVRERLIATRTRSTRSGWPALALPCGPAEGGLPASVQLVGRPRRRARARRRAPARARARIPRPRDGEGPGGADHHTG